MFILLPIPFIGGYLNRLSREDKFGSRWVWVFLNVILASFLSLDMGFTALYMLFMVTYEFPPTNAVYSARHGMPPARKDSWYWQWMQDAARAIVTALVGTPNGQAMPPNPRWQMFGMVYGAIEGLLMLPAAVAMVMYTESLLPLAIGFFMLMRGVYDYLFDAVWMDRIMGFILWAYLIGGVYALNH